MKLRTALNIQEFDNSKNKKYINKKEELFEEEDKEIGQGDDYINPSFVKPHKRISIKIDFTRLRGRDKNFK